MRHSWRADRQARAPRRSAHWSSGSRWLSGSRRVSLVVLVEVFRQQLTKLIGGGRLNIAQAPGVGADRGLERVAGKAAVAKGAAVCRHGQQLPETGQCLRGELVVGALGQQRQ